MSQDRRDSPAYVIVYAAIISAAFTAGIMGVYAATRGIVERNEELFFQKAMVELFDLGDVDALSDAQIVDLYETHIISLQQRRDPQTGQVFKSYGARKVPRDKRRPWHEIFPDDEALEPRERVEQLRREEARARFIGLAIPFSGTGFWARIDGYLAVNTDFTEIIGITFLAHQETPGLGGRITERAWRAKFVGLDVTPNPDGLVVYVGGEAPEPGSPRHGRHVDAISGATGTSSAIERFLNEQLEAFRRSEPVMYEGSTLIGVPSRTPHSE